MNRFDEACRRATRVLASEPARIDPRPKDRFHAMAPDGRWVELRGEACRELKPEEDAKLVMATSMPDLLDAAGFRALAYKPGRRLVVRVDSIDGPLVLKGYREGRSKPAAHRHRVAARALAGSGVEVPALRNHSLGWEVMELHLSPGATPPIEEASAPVFAALGRALRVLQEHGSDLPLHGRAEELKVLDDLAARVGGCQERLPAGWEAARGALEATALPADAPEPGPCHRDLHDLQLLVDGPRLTLLDFDLLCRADTALDAANLSAHLDLRALQGLRGSARAGAAACHRALLEGLGRAAEPGFGQRFAFYRSATFLRLSLVYALRPRWSFLCEPLVQHARRCLDDAAA